MQIVIEYWVVFCFELWCVRFHPNPKGCWVFPLTSIKQKSVGAEVANVAPAHTSQTCSKCGSLGNRDGKKFQCVCRHADHADVNASFNIGRPVSHCLIDPARIKSMSQLHAERDVCK